jgi:hypothetical protein
MRPCVALDPTQPRSRKQSVADQATTSSDRHNAPPMTFFLARGSDVFDTDDEPRTIIQGQGPSVRSLKETIDEISQSPAPNPSRSNEGSDRNSSRRRSTIKTLTPQNSRRDSSIHSTAPSLRQDEHSPTPLLPPSQEISIPSSPKSVSSQSLHRSEEGYASDENRSQAIVSSEGEDEDGELSSAIQDSAPQLIMPSIKMPSRRPFTVRGKRLGRFKILVAGGKGIPFVSQALVSYC